jgi:hypothetical protein
MVTTVTNNSPQAINTSLFALDSEIQKVKGGITKLKGLVDDGFSKFNFCYAKEDDNYSVTTEKGVFFYGCEHGYTIKMITTKTTVKPNNDFFGDPAADYPKIMIGFYL